MAAKFLTTQEKLAKFGTPNQSGTYLVSARIPFPLRLAWDKNTKVNSIRCHKDVADRVTKIFQEILDHYGYGRIQELGIDLFGGCFNYRPIRGGSEWSSHAWGIAIDLDPARNGLKTPWAKAQFSKPDYAPMVRIFEKYGFYSYGKERNFDSMHFEFVK